MTDLQKGLERAKPMQWGIQNKQRSFYGNWSNISMRTRIR